MNGWRRWVEQPQGLWLRRALFQVHVWTGIGAGLYILVVSVTGSLLVYRNELYRAVTPAPTLVSGSGPRLSPEALQEAVSRAYPGYSATVYTQRNPDRAVDVRLTRGTENKFRLFDPFTGNDLGDSIPPGVRIVSWLTDLHDNLLFGPTGRRINGIGALLWTGLAATGLVIWWPGIGTWRRSLTVRRHVGWKRFNWDLHSALGFWMLGFVLLFGITGVFLGYQQPFFEFADYLQPPTDENVGTRAVDSVTYWLAYLHFGRFGGWSTKAIWAVAGLAPACMFITGLLMWWNRIISKRIF